MKSDSAGMTLPLGVVISVALDCCSESHLARIDELNVLVHAAPGDIDFTIQPGEGAC